MVLVWPSTKVIQIILIGWKTWPAGEHMFENIYHFIDLNTSLSYIRMVMGEKLSWNLLIFHNFAKIQIISTPPPNTSLIFVYELS